MGSTIATTEKPVKMKSDENWTFAGTFLASVFRSTIHDCKVSNSSKSIRGGGGRGEFAKKKVRIRRGGEGSFPTNGLC